MWFISPQLLLTEKKTYDPLPIFVVAEHDCRTVDLLRCPRRQEIRRRPKPEVVYCFPTASDRNVNTILSMPIAEVAEQTVLCTCVKCC